MTTHAKAHRCYLIYQRCLASNAARAAFWLARYRCYQDRALDERRERAR